MSSCLWMSGKAGCGLTNSDKNHDRGNYPNDIFSQIIKLLMRNAHLGSNFMQKANTNIAGMFVRNRNSDL